MHNKEHIVMHHFNVAASESQLAY